MNNDIMEALYDVRVAFKKCGLEVPEAIVLKTHEEGMRLLHQIRDKAGGWVYDPQTGVAGKPVEHPDGSMYMHMEVMGMNIRWPANRIAMQNGGYLWT
jgi:hypothetical protein